MPQESLQALYNSVSEDYDVGTFDTFSDKMQDPTKRRSFYNAISNEFDLPEYDQFEARVTTTAPAINPQDVFIDPDEDLTTQPSFKNIIYDSVKRQEGSIAKNNPYGVNLPRKKGNVDKIRGLGGKVMEGSNTLLEFDSLEGGMKAGEDIIDNILSVSNNDPAVFYSTYSGLPIESPEVKSFVEIVGQKTKQSEPEKETNLQRIIKALEAGRDNPQHIIKAASEPDPAKALTVMGIPTAEIPGIEQPTQPEERKKLSAKEIAEAQNELFFKREIAKEKKKGLSERDAYRKVVSSVGGTPPNVVDLAMEKSITGAVFRIVGMDQKVNLDNYPSNQIEDIVSGAIAMIMPVDAMLFKGGGAAGQSISQLKKVGRYADEAANIIAKNTNMSLKQARVFAKNAVARMTGGAGGFGAFDSGRSIVDQIELTGTIDPLQTIEAAMKGVVTGGSVGFLGAVGSYKAGKAGEFIGEVLGLGTVAPVLEGEFDPTTEEGRKAIAQGYIDAAGTIIGLKVLKSFSPKQGTALKDMLAEEIKTQTETTGRPMHEVANRIGKELKTSVELAMEGRVPEKTVREKITEYEVAEGVKEPREPIEPGVNRAEVFAKEAETIKQLKKQGFSQAEAEQRSNTVLRDAGVKTEVETPVITNERTQLESQIRRLSEKMNELEKAGSEQRILDDLQIEIDGKVSRLNEFDGVTERAINELHFAEKPSRPMQREPKSVEEVASEVVEGRLKFQERIERLESQLSERDRAELDRYNKALEDKDVLNRVIKDDPSLKVPLHPPKEGKESSSKIKARLKREYIVEAKRKADAEQERLDKTLQERDILNRPFEPDPMLEVPLHPADAGRRAVAEIQTIEVAPDAPKAKPKGPTVKKKKLTGIDAKDNAKDHNVKVGDEVYVNKSGFVGIVRGFKRGKDTNVVTVENKSGVVQDLTDRNLFTPKKVYEENVNRKNRQPVSELEGQKRVEGFMLQKQLSDLDVTLQANEMRLRDRTLTETQRERLETSIQKTKELKRDTQDRAGSQGIELQSFMGIPSPRMLKQLFGSRKKKPKRHNDAEIDRLYNNAMQRLDRDAPKEEIKVKTVFTEQPIKERGPLSRVFSWFTGDMVQRVNAMDTPTSKEASALAKQAIDIQKETHGKLSKELDIALKASGQPFFTEGGKAVRDLSKFVEVEVNGNTVLMSRLHAGIEGLIKLKGKEAEIIEKHRDLIEKRGRIFEENGIMQEGKDGEVRPFKVIGRKIAPRIITGEFYRILQKGEYHPHFKLLVNEFSKATGQSPDVVTEYFGEIAQNIKGVTDIGSSLPTRTTQAEHSRKWKNIPHAVTIKGEVVPIIEYRPFEYARRLAETGESRVGVAKVFGQEVDKTSIVNEMKDQISKENGDPIVFHEMIRSLSGAPVEAPFREAGYTGSKASRAINSALSFIKNTTLSGSFFPNISEPLGNVRKHVGMPTLLKSIFKLSTSPKTIKAMLEAQGAITVDIANFTIDPNRPFSSFTRSVNEATRRGFGFKYINEFQEFLAAQAYAEKVQRFQNNKGTSRDVILLREMGFSETDAQLMVSGKAPQQMYDALVRRAPAYLTGGAQRRGEQSRLEHNKWFQAGTAFETYSQMKLRSFASSARTYSKLAQEAVNERNYKKFVDANRLMASEILGTTISGATTQFILATIYGGVDNAEIKWNEVKENPWEFLLESWAYSSFAGVFGSIIQSTSEGRLLENPWELSFPLSIVGELFKAADGKGKYTYLEAEDKFLEVAKRYLPINKAVKTIAVATGFGNEQTQKDDNAIRGYYRWRFKNKYGGKYIGNPDEELKTFRMNMKKAYNSIREGEDLTEADKHVINALDLTDKDEKSAVMSILGKRLLTKSKIAPGMSEPAYEERLDELRRTIGNDAYLRLERHDERLKDFASDWKM